MTSLFAVLLGILALSTLWLAFRLRALRREYDVLHQQLLQANESVGAISPDLRGLLKNEPATVICIEILNPLQLAANESWFAGKFGSLTPALIRRIVYDRALKICQETLTKFGAEAQVQVRRAP